METNSIGIILTVIGALTFLLNNTVTGWHQRVHGRKWNERFYWMSWKPIIGIKQPTGRKKVRIKIKHKALVYGMIPPKYKLEITGFLLILTGAILQMIY